MVCPTGNNVKTMLIIAYDWDGAILRHTIPQGHTIRSTTVSFWKRTCKQLYVENDGTA
jgi:hypothetical protein